MGSLPANLKSRILKSLTKGGDLDSVPPNFEQAEFLNKIRELPDEEYDDKPAKAQPKPKTSGKALKKIESRSEKSYNYSKQSESFN